MNDSGLTLGLKELNSKNQLPFGYMNNVFKTGTPSPMGSFYPSGMDSGTEAQRNAFYFPYSRAGAYPMFSPSGAASYRQGGGTRKDIEQSPRVDMIPGVFATPTSKGQPPFHHGDMSGRGDPGSFGASPRDISTTKAVFNQQMQKEVVGQGGKDSTKALTHYFAGSP